MSEIEAARWGPMEFRGAFERPFSELKPPHGGRFAGLEPQQGNAVDYLIQSIDRSPGEITFLALGPLTNLALALRLRPDLEGKIKHLVIMGGNVRVPGNSSPSAEFNFWFDPEAAQAALRSAIPRKTLFPLDVCNRAVIRASHFEEVIAVKTPVTDLYRQDMGVEYPGFFKNPDATRPLWDELTAAWLIDPASMTRSESLYLDVETTFGPRYGAARELDRKLAPAATPVTVFFDLDFPRVFRVYKRLLCQN
jgi:inosine-uridine nucleoside N-ribohydrolase